MKKSKQSKNREVRNKVTLGDQYEDKMNKLETKKHQQQITKVGSMRKRTSETVYVFPKNMSIIS